MIENSKDSNIAPAPIILFVYNRPEHAKKTVEALARNILARDSELWVFADAARNQAAVETVAEVRSYIHELVDSDWFANVSIIEATQNKGLAKSIIDGVSQVMESKKRVIVLEDDLVTAPDFLVFMNECLHFYENNQIIGSITGYSPLKVFPTDYSESVYMIPRSSSLGWATWVDRWQQVDWEVSDYAKFKKNMIERWRFDRCGSDRSDRLRRQMKADIGSWSIRFGYWQFRQKMNTVYPVRTRILNIGDDGSGIHNSTGVTYNNDLSNQPVPFELSSPLPDPRIIKQVRKVYSGGNLSRLSRLLRNNGLGWLDQLLKN